jgi:predicted tellurium resistance membrane protein TerC
MEWLNDPQAWIALLTLTLLEIVLGIDNVIFISILAGKLPTEPEQKRARSIGLMAALVMRVLLLLSIAWIVKLTAPWFTILGQEISGRDLILLVGGLFLIAKATHEIHEKLEGEEGEKVVKATPKLSAIIIQIMALDIVFSLDSVITAVGMAKDIGVMITAVIISVGIMLFSAGAISGFVNRHPTVKMLALSFLLLIGTALVAEGLEFHIPKGYIYFAMAFSVLVELLNMRMRRGKPVQLHDAYHEPKP